GIDSVHLANQKVRAIDGLFLGQEFGNLVFLELAAQLLDFFLQFPLALQQFANFVHRIIGAGTNQIADLFESLFVAPYEIQGSLSGKGLDASYTGSDPAFERKLEDTNFSGMMDVCAAAQFGGEITDLHHADAIAVLVAKESEGAFAEGVLVTRLFDPDIRVLANAFVDRRLNKLQFLFRNRSRVMEIEPQAIRRDQRACLANMRPELFTQYRV